MYSRFTKIPTKKEYQQVLEDTIAFITKLSIKESDSIYPYIVNELNDIYQVIILNKTNLDSDDVFEKYDIGAISIHYFEESEEIHQRLSDVFFGTVHYQELSDE